MQLVISRKEAQARGNKRYFTGVPCKNGHVAERNAGNQRCLACANLASRAWRERNPEKQKVAERKWKEKNPEKLRTLKRKWQLANVEKTRVTSRTWRARHPELNRERCRAWKKNNPEKQRVIRRVDSANRRARKISATPPWFPQEANAIKIIYALAAALGWHVDHIVPLNGINVCGLHCLANLRICPPEVNLAKSNKFGDYREAA